MGRDIVFETLLTWLMIYVVQFCMLYDNIKFAIAHDCIALTPSNFLLPSGN